MTHREKNRLQQSSCSLSAKAQYGEWGNLINTELNKEKDFKHKLELEE